MIRILHSADLHLDSPFRSLGAGQSEARREEQRELFRALICAAKNRRADLLLIAGDLFDSGFTSSSTLKFVADMLATLDCPVIISPGNHDPYREGGVYSAVFPSNVRIFTSEKISSFYFPKLNVCVHGYAFTGVAHEAAPLAEPLKLDPSKINILCAHTDLDMPTSKNAPIMKKELAASGFDYAALGHIHNPPPVEKLGKTLTAYSGCIEGRSYDECGYGGIIEVNIDMDSIKHERIRLAKHRYMIEKIDITGCENDTETLEKLRARLAISNYGDDTALRIRLIGAVPPSYTPSTRALKEAIRGLYAVDIKDETSPILDHGELSEDMSIRGEFYRELIRRMKDGTPEERKTAAEALRIGLSALEGKPIIF